MQVNKYQVAFDETQVDKLLHGYHRYYENVVSDTDISSVLEIGVWRGDSLKAWKLIWPDAIVEGLEKSATYQPSINEEFKIHRLNSQNFDETAYIGEYDIIIDDACHHWRSQVATFNNFYHKAKKFYVIEDVLGVYGLANLKRCLPESELSRAMLFTSTGPTRNFRFSEYVEKNAHYKFMIFDKTS
jgi:hypothetical protein